MKEKFFDILTPAIVIISRPNSVKVSFYDQHIAFTTFCPEILETFSTKFDICGLKWILNITNYFVVIGKAQAIRTLRPGAKF
jgi:hypothetical protein